MSLHFFGNSDHVSNNPPDASGMNFKEKKKNFATKMSLVIFAFAIYEFLASREAHEKKTKR
jgi:hypothetical protein